MTRAQNRDQVTSVLNLQLDIGRSLGNTIGNVLCCLFSIALYSMVLRHGKVCYLLCTTIAIQFTDFFIMRVKTSVP